MKFKNILFFTALLFNLIDLKGQNKKDTGQGLSNLSFRERITFNVGGGFMLGNTYSNINIQPQVGYRITKNFTAGIGSNFQYYKNTYISSDAFLIYGGNAFARYRISKEIFVQSEYQMLNFQQQWGQYALIGGGYTPAAGLYVSAYYLLLYPSNNIYNAPYVVRVGFMF